jgi:hypothetical protein
MNPDFQVLGKVERVVPNALSGRPLANQRVEDNALHLGLHGFHISDSGGLR